jgi:hypothetical protein
VSELAFSLSFGAGVWSRLSFGLGFTF